MKIKNEYGGKKITVCHKECTVSTNIDARQSKKDGTLVVADRQTGGRGRMGRQFVSNAGGVYFSLFLDLKDGGDALFLTSAAAVAAAEAAEKLTGEQIKIKWVNDLYCNDKKVCGILAEGEIKNGKITSAVLGVGLNLIRKTEFEGELSKKAGFLFSDGDFSLLRDTFLESFLEKFFELFYCGKKEEIKTAYIERNYLEGKKISFVIDGKKHEGTVLGVDENINLLAEENGKTVSLCFGEAEIII